MDLEQCVNIKFCFKLGKSPKETHEMLILVYGDAAVTLKTVYKWFDRFRKGFESIDIEERDGRPATSCANTNIAKVNEMVL